MTADLLVAVGQATDRGRKPENQDSLGVIIPSGEALRLKGVAAVIADGVSSCAAPREAAETCVTGVLNDYFSTPDSWRVETAASRVIGALNRWLHGEGTRRHGHQQGLLCTLSLAILKGDCGYLFHVGDSRISLIRDGELESLTRDHHLGQGVLNRAMGADVHVELDYRRLPLQAGDIFLLTTDGIHDTLAPETLRDLASDPDPERAARALVDAAYRAGSEDNLSAQVIRVISIPDDDLLTHYQRLAELQIPPPLDPGHRLDGYRIIRELHANKRSQVYLAEHEASGQQVVIKAPSPNMRDDAPFLDQFLTEAWVASRINNPHVLRFHPAPAGRRLLYVVTDYVPGQTLREWMAQHPRPSLATVRELVAQVARGLRAFHRLDMVHQDLKPENIMVDADGTVRIIDMGSVRVPGTESVKRPWGEAGYLGTASYGAPECLAGQPGSPAADRYALGVITYELLTGQLPYAQPPQPGQRHHPRYRSLRQLRPDLPGWLDACLEKAVAPLASRRYPALSDFITELYQPDPALLRQAAQRPLVERMAPDHWRLLASVSVLLNLLLLAVLLLH